MKIVLGGGIGGLSAGYYLRNKFTGDGIKIIEQSGRVGGWIKSTKLLNDVIFEQGPRTLRPKGEAGYNTLKLIEEIGLSKNINPIVSTHPAAKIRMIYVNGQLHTLPSSLKEIFQKFSPFSKPLFLFVLNDLFAKPKESVTNDESIYSFVERRFGQEIAQYAISPMICGICAGDAKEISVKFLMKSLYEKEQKYGGIIIGTLLDALKNGFPKSKTGISSLVHKARKEKWNVYSFDEGMEVFPSTLRDKLIDQGVSIELNKTVKKITFSHNIVFVTKSGAHKPDIADHIVSSLPTSELAKLVEESHPMLAFNLKRIQAVDVAVVNLQFGNTSSLKQAFGFLVPPSENLPILGVIFDSCCFPNKDKTVLTVMMGGHWFKQLFGNNPKPEYLLDVALKQIKNTLNITDTPENYKVNVLRNCIPQYRVGHSEIIKNIEHYIKDHKLPLSICGSSYYGVGVNDVILSAKKAVDHIK